MILMHSQVTLSCYYARHMSTVPKMIHGVSIWNLFVGAIVRIANEIVSSGNLETGSQSSTQLSKNHHQRFETYDTLQVRPISASKLTAGWVYSTPESMTAILTPLPNTPCS